MPARRADGRTVTYTAIESQMVVSYVTVPTTVVSTVHLTETAVQAVPTTVVETQVATEMVTDTQVLNQYVCVPLSSERERSVECRTVVQTQTEVATEIRSVTQTQVQTQLAVSVGRFKPVHSHGVART